MKLNQFLDLLFSSFYLRYLLLLVVTKAVKCISRISNYLTALRLWLDTARYCLSSEKWSVLTPMGPPRLTTPFIVNVRARSGNLARRDVVQCKQHRYVIDELTRNVYVLIKGFISQRRIVPS